MSRPSVKAWRNTRGKSAPLAQLQAAVEVLEQPVHAGVGDDAEKVQIRPVFQGICDGGVQLGVVEKRRRCGSALVMRTDS